jgi:hypothetical protein
MKWIGLPIGAVVGALIVFLLLPRYQLIETRSTLGCYVLRVDRWTGKSCYWEGNSSIWRDIE